MRVAGGNLKWKLTFEALARQEELLSPSCYGAALTRTKRLGEPTFESPEKCFASRLRGSLWHHRRPPMPIPLPRPAPPLSPGPARREREGPGNGSPSYKLTQQDKGGKMVKVAEV